ncbi:MAG: tetratricopeptide repeat protein [Alphaproteobacteria bacterium]|nr:tetratricopeptide repeat protein [Alphaproteobacteria bacterium]
MFSSYDHLSTLALFSGALVVTGILIRANISASKKQKSKNLKEEIADINIDEAMIEAAAASRDETYRSKNDDLKFEISNDMKAELDSLGISDDGQNSPLTAEETEQALRANDQIDYFIKSQVSQTKSGTNISKDTININLAAHTSKNKSKTIASLLSRIWSLIHTTEDNYEIIQKLIETHVLKKPGTNLFSIIEALRCFHNASEKQEDKTPSDIVIHNLRHGDVTKLLETLEKLAQRKERSARTSTDTEAKQNTFRDASNFYCHIGTISGLHDINEAIAATDKAIAFDRDNPYAWDRLGDISWELKNYKTAEKAYTRALLLSNRKENKLLTLNASTRLAQIYRGREDIQLAENMDEEIKYLIKEVSTAKESNALINILKMISKNRAGKAIEIGGAKGWQSATK